MNGIVQQCFDRRRDLPIALAHSVLRCKPNDPALHVLNRLYTGLSPADKILCRIELQKCREARRGNIKAEIVT